MRGRLDKLIARLPILHRRIVFVRFEDTHLAGQTCQLFANYGVFFLHLELSSLYRFLSQCLWVRARVLSCRVNGVRGGYGEGGGVT